MGKHGKSRGRSSHGKSRGRSSGRSKRGSVSSSHSSGCVTRYGTKVHNPKAYARTGAPLYSARAGKKVNNVANFTSAVRRNSIQAAAKSVVKRNPNAKAFTYTATLQGGKKYVGFTAHPSARLKNHSSGTGARVTRELRPVNVTITPHRSVAAAKRAETSTYFAQKSKFGGGNVRGAGCSSRFSLA